MLDFSNRTELTYLADLARAFGRVSGDMPYFLAGATARDLLLEHAHDINPGRNTRDLDRTIAWPPDGDVVMSVFGFREVYDHTLLVQLPGGETIRVVSLASLFILKLVAWGERRWHRPGADAHDIAVILRHYLDAGNLQRLYTEASHLLDALDFDYEEAGAWLLGHDMARLLPESAHPHLQDLLNRESDANGAVNLVGDLPIDADRGLKLLQNLAKGFLETQNP